MLRSQALPLPGSPPPWLGVGVNEMTKKDKAIQRQYSLRTGMYREMAEVLVCDADQVRLPLWASANIWSLLFVP